MLSDRLTAQESHENSQLPPKLVICRVTTAVEFRKQDRQSVAKCQRKDSIIFRNNQYMANFVKYGYIFQK